MTQPKSRIKLIIVIAAIAVAVVVGALVVSAIIPSSQPLGENAWLFKGAYAIYEGSTSINAEELGMLNMSLTMDFTIRQEIVDFNDTNALISFSYQMSSSIGEFGGDTEQNEISEWVPLSEMGLMTAFEDVEITNSYESTVNIDGIGTRTCIIYEFKIEDQGLAMTVYVDKTIEWPLKIMLSMTNTEFSGLDLELDINLVETNIPSLN